MRRLASGRRGFLAALAALAAAPFVKRAAAEPLRVDQVLAYPEPPAFINGGYYAGRGQVQAVLHGQEFVVPEGRLAEFVVAALRKASASAVVIVLAFLWSQPALAGVADPPVEKGFVVEQLCYRDGVKVDCPKFSLHLRAGVLGGKAADVDIRPLPAFAIRAAFDLVSLAGGPVGQVDVELTGLPDEAGVDVEQPATSVKAFDASFAAIQSLGSVLRFNLYARVGLASRLAASSDPALRLPGYASFGIDVHSADGDHWLQVGLGPDQRLSGEWVPTVQALAGLLVKEATKVKVWLVGGFIRALDLSAYGYKPPARDWWTVSAQAGWGNR